MNIIRVQNKGIKRKIVTMNIVPDFVRRKIEHRPNLLRIVDNIGWLFFDKMLRMGVGLLVGVWVARYLGPEKFGQLNFTTAFVSIFGAIAGLGLNGIVVRDIIRDPSLREETLGTAAVLHMMAGVLAYAFMFVGIIWLRPDDSVVKTLGAILGSILLFKASDVAVYWFESQVQSKYTVWVQNGVFLTFAAIKVSLILSGAPLTAFAFATMGEALAVSLLMLIMLSVRGIKMRRLKVTLLRARALLKDCWPLLLSGIAIMIYMRIDQIMLGQMVGNESVGIYSAAARISEVWYFIPIAIVASVFPAILEAKKRSEAEYYAKLQNLFDLMVAIGVGVALPMTFLSGFAVDVLFGDTYSDAGVLLAIQIWNAVFVFLGVASEKWFLVENRQFLSLQRTALGAVANISLNLIFIPIYGAIGAAVATVISQMIAAWVFDVIQPVTRRMFFMKLNSMNLIRLAGRAVKGGENA